MHLLLAFGAVLLIAVLLSERAHRSVLSTTVLFLVAGFLVGPGVLGWVPAQRLDDVATGFAEVALFSILYVDGTRLPLRHITAAWRLPGLALAVGLPLTIAAMAVAARLLLGLPWAEAFLLGAILCPTDPVFAAAFLERESVPHRVRHMLGLESALNDGLALPVVMVLLAAASREESQVLRALVEVALGVAVGIALPWLCIRLERSRFFAATESYRTLGVFGVGLTLFALGHVLPLNMYLAAFAAGVTVATMDPPGARGFIGFGGHLAELAKLSAVLVFGALLTPGFLARVGGRGYLFAVVALIAARPLALLVTIRQLSLREWLAAAWFGPKGFASVLYGLLALHGRLTHGQQLFDLVALVAAASMILHSSTDVAVAHSFGREEGSGKPTG